MHANILDIGEMDIRACAKSTISIFAIFIALAFLTQAQLVVIRGNTLGLSPSAAVINTAISTLHLALVLVCACSQRENADKTSDSRGAFRSFGRMMVMPMAVHCVCTFALYADSHATFRPLFSMQRSHLLTVITIDLSCLLHSRKALPAIPASHLSRLHLAYSAQQLS